MTPILLKFSANFVAIIVLAMSIDSQKERIAQYLEAKDDETDPECIVAGIKTINTMSLSFSSAINTYACFTVRSSYLLTVVGLAYLANLVVFLIKNRCNRGPQASA